MNHAAGRLVIASNRLPIVISGKGRKRTVKPGSGGLVTAMAPVLKNRGGVWVGWPGTSGKDDISDLLKVASKDAGYSIKPVMLSEEDIQKYYYGLSNEVLWPLFHDLQSYCNFEPAYWETYTKVNRKFAEAIAENARPKDFIWVHDYQLICVAQELRRLGLKTKIGFFLHIPFPPLDIFVKLPWRSEILKALTEYDLIGFQTMRDRRNFIQCLRTLTPHLSVKGKGHVVSVSVGDRTIRVGTFPISIDYNDFRRRAETKDVADRAWFLHEDIPDRKIVLCVDRLDYTKGIRYRFKAFQKLLDRHPELHGKLTLVQVVVPSRAGIPVYDDIKTEIERLVSDINGRYTISGWVPIHYIYRSLDKEDLLAYYRTAEIALVTPLKDGMNLVAKEYCASNIEEKGVLILSEFAGAAAQLHKGAIMVNPYNIEEVAMALYKAYIMDDRERKSRMKKMRLSIRRQDIYWWVNSYLDAAIARRLDGFPVMEDYNPVVDVGNSDNSSNGKMMSAGYATV
jgi:trehalose 6-phosphate synthase/phosphatase